jgi:polyphosphate glucokinase
VDVGATDLKAVLLDSRGRSRGRPRRVPTPRPATPAVLQAAIHDLVQELGAFQRCSVGFPGVVIAGRVETAVNLGEAFRGCRLDRSLARLLGVPVRVANDADLHGLGVVRGRGVELVVTLGTGFGSALFVDGILVPNLEMGHHPFRRGRTYEQLLGLAALKRSGLERWSSRLQEAIEELRRLFHFRTLYLGGGNSRLIDFPRARDVKVVSNRAGLRGGIRLWEQAAGD